MPIKMRATKNFSGPDGKLYIGDVFEAKDEARAQFLTEGGYATREEAPVAETPALAPVRQPAPSPAATPAAAPANNPAK